MIFNIDKRTAADIIDAIDDYKQSDSFDPDIRQQNNLADFKQRLRAAFHL